MEKVMMGRVNRQGF